MPDFIKLTAPDGVVIEAPVDGWRTCDCGVLGLADGSNWCDDCKERFERSWDECFDSAGRPPQADS
ncbi:hypothetical protein BVH03_09425 [Pseudomonas sp. PA15(2017)]|uniref:hypothetical protein n=1 Tax=Pseudomonas sp. PA15(2017) TaxID=1932111 RepID=UPI00095D72CA|nr:hypothetical protein [Pseudomonas sp. PA15(2017)]OLU30968.1 hypothetical protein BVH03_09425 [Pseudomonas sp. PA15(2017)]